MIGEAWALKESFRGISRAADPSEAELRLDHFTAAVKRAVLPAFSALAAGLGNRRKQLLH